VLNFDRAAENILQLPKSCMELCIFICLCTDPTNSGNVLQDSLLQSPLALQTTLKVDLKNEEYAQSNEL
jgi:hypothetical protein